MKRKLAAQIIIASLLAVPIHAAPKVVTDIPPIHSLVSRVMEGVGEPDLIIPAGSTPHDYAMRPSSARMISKADVIFWVGEGLTRWMARAIGSLGNNAVSVELMEADGIDLLEMSEAGHDGHDHGNFDPHIWLDPDIAKAILEIAAAELARIDPENSSAYASNLASGLSELDELSIRIEKTIEPVRNYRFVTAHDAYSYFEHRFGIESLGSVSTTEGVAPGPARLKKLRDTIREKNVACIFIEPQINQKIVKTAAEGSGARIGILDPLGADLESGPDLYGNLLKNLASNLAGCLAAGNE